MNKNNKKDKIKENIPYAQILEFKYLKHDINKDRKNVIN